MFPVNGSLPWRRPSLPWVPASPVPHLRRYYDGATTSRPRIPRSLMCSLPEPTVLLRSSCSPKRSRGSGGLLSGQGQLFSRRPAFRRACAWTRAGSLRFPGDPSCTFALFQDPGRTDTASPLSVLPMLPPVPTLRRLQRHHDFGANPRLRCLLPTLHERRCRRPCKARFRLAGCAFTGRESNPLDRFERFRTTCSSSFPGLTLTQAGHTAGASSLCSPT